MKKIYFVRHGQTDYNLKEIIQGAVDIELNETGIKQAYDAKEKLKNIHFDKIYSSPLKRAKKTADIISEKRDVKVEVEDRLREICFGINEGNKYGTYDYKGFWNYNNPHLYPEAENVRDFLKRVSDFLDTLKNIDAENILLVAHGGVSKAVTAYFKGIPEDGQIDELAKIENCQMLQFELV